MELTEFPELYHRLTIFVFEQNARRPSFLRRAFWLEHESSGLAGAPKNAISFENDLQNILLKVAAGKGLSIMSTLFVNWAIENVHVANLEYEPNEIDVNIVMAYKKDNRNPALALLMQGVQS